VGLPADHCAIADHAARAELRARMQDDIPADLNITRNRHIVGDQQTRSSFGGL
jgi:hypothetical protein